MRSLKGMLLEMGVDLGDWNLEIAWDISADGKTIVGTATSQQLNRQEAFIVVIPEPQISALLMVGGGLLACRFWHRNQKL